MRKLFYKLGLISHKKYVIWKLIRIYSKALGVIKHMNHPNLILDYLFERDLDNGVCSTAYRRLGVYIYNEDWVKQYLSNDGVYWARPPFECTTKQQIMQSLATRLVILYEEYYK